LGEHPERAQLVGHQEAAEPGDQLHSWGDQEEAEPDDRSNSPDDQAAGQQGDQALHQQAVAVYRCEVRLVLMQPDAVQPGAALRE
jgi:hypothetical protein